MEGKLYRFHRTTGTVHYIPGCCRFGDVSNPNVHADNFDECYTYEEAENILKHRHRDAHQCKRCVFPSEKGGKQNKEASIGVTYFVGSFVGIQYWRCRV